MKYLKAGIIAALVFVITGIAAPEQSWALLDGLLGKKQAAPQGYQYPIQNEESFRDVAKSFHRIPFNNPNLEFDILLPKDWTVEQTIQSDNTADLSQKILGDIARFESPVIGTWQASVVIQTQRLEQEITAANWLKDYISKHSYTLQDKIVAISDKRANTAFLSATEDQNMYVYANVQINGNLLILVRFETPLPLKDTLTFLRKRAAESFRLILTNDDPIEQQKSFTLPNALQLTFPESWTLLYPDIKNTNNMSIQLHNEKNANQIDGLIRFVAVKRGAGTNLSAEVEKMKKYFDKFLKLDFKKMVSSDKAAVYNRFIFSRQEIYRVAFRQKDSTDQELRFVALGDKNWYIFMFLLSPVPESNFYTWAVNNATFDIILKKLR